MPGFLSFVDSGSNLQNGLCCIFGETKLLSSRSKALSNSIGVENREDAAGHLNEVGVNRMRRGFNVIENRVAAVFGFCEEPVVVAFAFGHHIK